MIEDIRVMQSFLDTMTGIEKFSYPARQNNADRPEGEFAHVRLLEEYPESIPANYVFSQTDNETVFRSRSLARLRFRVGVADTNGVPSSKIMHGWTSEPMKALMLSSGYGFIKCTPISNEDAKLEKEWEARQGFAIELYVTRTYEETTNNITSLVVNGEFITPGLDIFLLQFNINE